MGICGSSNETRQELRRNKENNNESNNQPQNVKTSNMNQNQMNIAKTLKKNPTMFVAQSNHLAFPKGKALLFSRQEE